MTIIPKIVLDEKDFLPYVEEFKKKLGDTSEFIITSIVPVTTGNGQWTVEIGAEPVKQTNDERKMARENNEKKG